MKLYTSILMRPSARLAYLLAFIFLTGCLASGLDRSPEKTLAETASAYYKLFMWKYFEKASAFVYVDKRDKFDRAASRPESDLNITSYDIKEVVIAPNSKDEGLVRVSLTYYKYPSVSEKTVLLEDPWIKKDGNWYVDSDFESPIFQ